ncbi:MAG: hypothetical protein M1819_002954 [Sarea resinae]|nr:MAG: hypothetical protein M1819_002954 [Sarea resinae]
MNRILLRHARAPLSPSPLPRISRRRLFSTKPDDVHPSAARQAQSRLDRILARLPRFLHRYTNPLRTAPLTHITSFLLLHELTAIIPLFGLAAAFHYTNYLPPYISEGRWVSDGVEKFGNYFRRKGWIEEEGDVGEDGKKKRGFRGKWWGRGEGGVRIVVEVATAYAITKALLPVRLVFSVWATPWFARISIIPFTKAARRLFTRAKPATVPRGAAARSDPVGRDAGPKAVPKDGHHASRKDGGDVVLKDDIAASGRGRS